MSLSKALKWQLEGWMETVDAIQPALPLGALKYLKKQLPPHLTYDAYIQDSDAWLYSACWRARVMRDPYLALGRLLQDEPEDEEQMWSSGDEEEAGEDEEESDDEDE